MVLMARWMQRIVELVEQCVGIARCFDDPGILVDEFVTQSLDSTGRDPAEALHRLSVDSSVQENPVVVVIAEVPTL